MKIDLTWGESVAVREEFVKLVPNIIVADLMNMNYAPFVGDDTLIQHTRDVILRQTGNEYKHVVLTNGAAGGCVIAMRAFSLMGWEYALTATPPYFSLYPSMIKAAGLNHKIDRPLTGTSNAVYLLDSPSNPEGLYREGRDSSTVIWDAVYANRVYSTLTYAPKHEVLVGSYSKLTGLNGIRIGWIATDNDFLADLIKELVAAEYCGLSSASVNILNAVLPNFAWETFEHRSRIVLDLNRESWSKLEKFFGGKPTSATGMFFYGPMDKTCQKLFEKAGIVWTPGSKLGDSDEYGRFNIGQSRDVLLKVVSQVLKTDKL